VTTTVALLAAALLVPSGITADPATGAPALAVTPPSTEPGATITIDGAGFDRRQNGTIGLDAAASASVPFQATGHGDFSVELAIPLDEPAGAHSVVARDGAGDIATTTIDVIGPASAPSASAAPTVGPTPTPSASTTYTLDDEFDGSGLAPVWGTSGHWSGLSEATIDRRHTTVANGVMTITATRTSPNVWVSDTVDTFGRFGQTYGYFEARLKFTSGKGLWPAFWLAHDWTGDKSELDINETLANAYTGACGDNSGAYYATVHLADGSAPQGSHRYCPGYDLANAWHTYGMDWRSDHIGFYVDGKLWYTYTGTIPTTPMAVIFNLAVGGWAGASDSTTPSPSVLQVDWLRVRA
jgi:hypothetical protein